MVPIPSEADEDARRSIRERTELVAERVSLVNRIGAVWPLWACKVTIHFAEIAARA
jgi:hypothetical protein